MSVQNESYVIFGAKLDYNKVSLEYDKDYERIGNLMLPKGPNRAVGCLGLLFDGMNGQYCVAGKCLALEKPEAEEYFECFKVPINNSAFLAYEVRKWIEDNGLSDLVGNNSFAFYVVGHHH